MLETFFKYLLKEWAVIRDTPVAFCTLLILGWFVIGAGLEVFHREKMEASNIRTDHLFNLVDQYREKAGETPNVAKDKIEELQKELNKLRAETNATVSFLGPESIKLVGGSYVVRGTMRINATTPKSGLTFGFTTEHFLDFRIVAATDPIINCGPYNLPALAELGLKRFHCRNVNGAYVFELRVSSAGPVTIRHRIEGKEEGPVVTWQIGASL